MNREQAIAGIESDDSDLRLAAARFFSSNASGDDLALLRKIEESESVPWIQRALRIARERVSSPAPVSSPAVEQNEDQEIAASSYSRAVRDVSGRILHEFGSLIGGLLIAAPKEVERYPESQTRLLVEHLSDLSQALRSMRTVTATPQFEEIELSPLINGIIGSQPNEEGPKIIVTGPEDFLVSADKSQLSIAFSNGLRNALESASEAKKAPLVVVSWGFTGHENWIFIKDNGGGVSFDLEEIFKEGVSSKDGHSGYGLALVRQAMVSMAGEVILRNEEEGAHFELRWFRKNENTIR